MTNLLLFTLTSLITMQHFVCIFVNMWHHLSVQVQFIVTVPSESCQKQVLTFHHIPKSLVSLGLYVLKSEKIQTKMFVWKVSFFLCYQTFQNFQTPLPFHSLGLYVLKSEKIQTKIFVWKVSFFLCYQTFQNFQTPLPFHSPNFKFYCIFFLQLSRISSVGKS